MINAKISSTSLPLDAGAGVGTSSSTKGPDDVEYWRHQCHEKDIELEKIRQDFEQKNAFRDIEERLMSVSFHTMVSFCFFFYHRYRKFLINLQLKYFRHSIYNEKRPKIVSIRIIFHQIQHSYRDNDRLVQENLLFHPGIYRKFF